MATLPKYATVPVKLVDDTGAPATSTTATAVVYETFDATAVAFKDFITTRGTLIIPAGATSGSVRVRLRYDTASLTAKQFGFRILSSSPAALGATTSEMVVIGGPPSYPAVAFPGRRAGILGDSISYMNHHWNPPAPSVPGSSVLRYEFYGTGVTGWFTYMNEIMGNVFELEPAMQPNTNPLPNSQAPNNGYNFALYSSKVSQWGLSDFDPLNGSLTGTLAHNIGCMVNARQYKDNVDVFFIHGGTNDLSGGASATLADTTLNLIKADALELAALGKWVVIITPLPRTTQLLQAVNGVGGYTTAEIVQILTNLKYVRDQLVIWGATNPTNIIISDPWDDLVGPTASVLAGIPTDPAGYLSPATGYVVGGNINPTVGNYRTDAPDVIMMFDGLHPAAGGGYVIGKKLAVDLKAGPLIVPDAIAGQLGPLTIGANMLSNPSFTVTRTPRVLGGLLRLGRSTCLGAPVGWVSPGFPVGYTGTSVDTIANQGQGYAHGDVPDDFKLYRLWNALNGVGDGVTVAGVRQEESYSNFTNYTFSNFTSSGPAGSAPPPIGFTVDSTFPDGAIISTIVTDGAGRKGWQIDVNIPAGLTRNEGFIIRYIQGPGQHGAWDNYGFENGSTASVIPTVYEPGDYVSGEVECHYSNLSHNMSEARFDVDMLSINNTQVAAGDISTSGATVSGIAHVETYFPFSNVVNSQQHTEDKILFHRTPAVKAPTPASGENLQMCYFNWGFSWDCSVIGATARLTFFAPRLAVLTGPTL